MGKLTDVAKSNSNWLKLDIGESTVVKFLDYDIVPNSMDPTKKSAQFKLEENGVPKYWTSGNSRVLKFFDGIKKNTWVKISRDVWLDKEGKVVDGKSSWTAEESEKPEAPAEKPQEEKAWDE